MLKMNKNLLSENEQLSIRSLYDKHGGMLLGYIFEVVQDRKLAEECLVKLFGELALQFNKIDWKTSNSWCQLQKFAKTRLISIIASKRIRTNHTACTLQSLSGKSYLSELTEIQQQVFCDVYYDGKSVNIIAIELNQTEESIRKTLKEAFAIMRKGGEN